MTRIVHRAFVALGFAVGFSAFAANVSADGWAGGKGMVAAMELDGTKILESSCPVKGLSHDYVTCGKDLRDRVKERLCAQKGKGTHKYLYRVSDSKPTTSSVYCK